MIDLKSYLLCEFLVQSVRSSIAVHDLRRLSLSVYVIAFCAASQIAFETLKLGNDGHEWKTFAAANCEFMMPIFAKVAFCPDEFFICCTVSRMLCKWLNESSNMLLYLAPGLCGVTEMIGTMLQLMLLMWWLLMRMLLFVVCPDGVVIVIVLLIELLLFILLFWLLLLVLKWPFEALPLDGVPLA